MVVGRQADAELKLVNYISCKNTFGVKKVRPSKAESYLEVNT